MKKTKWYARLVVGIVVIAGLLLIPVVAADVVEKEYGTFSLQGDVNGDGVVNYDDVWLLERIILGVEEVTEGADVNGDGRVDMGDVTALENIILKNPGDANLDGEINMGDVTKVERIILTIDSPVDNADANKDGSIDMGDVTHIERMILGLV